MKLTLRQIETTVANEAQLTEKELTRLSFQERCEQKRLEAKTLLKNHPYYGLTDGTWLTRYPAKICRLPRAWVIEFLQAGGQFDSCHNWGVSPEAFNLSNFNPVLLAKAGKLFGRYDYLSTSVIEDVYSMFEPKTRAEYHRAERGISRSKQLKKYNIETTKSILSLGWMSEQKFTEYFFKNISDENVVFEKGEVCGICPINPYMVDFSKINHWGISHIIKCWDIYLEGRDRHYYRRGHNDRTHGVKSKKMARYLAAKGYFGTDDIHKLKLKLILPTFTFINRTSEGLLYSGAGLLFTKSKEISTRPFSGGRLAKIGKHFFIFSNDFIEHVEGLDLKETLQIWLSKKKKGGLVFSLNNVRNDRKGTAAFCLTGTKSFLKDRMPFVYGLIKNFNNWGDIPKSIMQVEWELASHEIFKGYPHP